MIRPISVRVDLHASAGYVEYVADVEVAGTEDVWHDGQVAADLDETGRVLGIEVLGFDNETLQRAREYAESKDLAFPPHLEGVLVAA